MKSSCTLLALVLVGLLRFRAEGAPDVAAAAASKTAAPTDRPSLATVRVAGLVLKWHGAQIVCTTECFLDGYFDLPLTPLPSAGSSSGSK